MSTAKCSTPYNNNMSQKHKNTASATDSTMPACCLGDKCRNKGLQLRSGHKCRQCRQIVHSINCSVVDESRDAHDNLLCLNCSNNKETTETRDTASIQNEKDQGTTEATTNLSKLTPGSGKGNMDKKKAAQRKKKKKKQPPKLPARAEKIAKTPNQKSFVLQSDQSTPDPLVMKTVCFDVNDKKYGTELANHLFPEDASKITPSTRNINGKSYLYGTITGATKKKRARLNCTMCNGRIRLLARHRSNFVF